MKKFKEKGYVFLAVIVILAVALFVGGEPCYAGGELFVSKVIEKDTGYNLSGKYNFEALNGGNFYVKGDVGFDNLNRTTSETFEGGGKYVLTKTTSLLGSYKTTEYDTSVDDKAYEGTVALDTNIVGNWTIRTQFKDKNGTGETTIGFGTVF